MSAGKALGRLDVAVQRFEEARTSAAVTQAHAQRASALYGVVGVPTLLLALTVIAYSFIDRSTVPHWLAMSNGIANLVAALLLKRARALASRSVEQARLVAERAEAVILLDAQRPEEP